MSQLSDISEPGKSRYKPVAEVNTSAIISRKPTKRMEPDKKPDQHLPTYKTRRPQEDTTRTVSRVNFDSIYTYLDIIIVLILVLSGTFVYSLKDTYHWIPPFMVLAYTLIFMLLTVAKQRHIMKRVSYPPICIGAAWTWLIWIVYGILFQNVHPLVGATMGYLQSLVVICLVLSTYWKHLQKNTGYMHSVSFTMILLLFIPHEDSVSYSLSREVLFAKTITFYTIYMMTEIINVIEKERMIFNNDQYYKSVFIYDLERTIVHSSWVLLTSKYLILGAVLQLIPIFITLRSSYGSRAKAEDFKLEEQTRQSQSNGSQEQLEVVVMPQDNQKRIDRPPTPPVKQQRKDQRPPPSTKKTSYPHTDNRFRNLKYRL